MKSIVNGLERLVNRVQNAIKAFLFKHEKINSIYTLTKMQTKNKKRLVKQINFKDKLILFVVKILLFVGAFFAFKYGITFFLYITKLQYMALALRIKGNYTTFVLAIFLIVSILSAAIHFIHDIYRAKDNSLLLSYPVNTRDIFISKLLCKIVHEFKKSFYLFLPFMVGVYLNKATTYNLTSSFIWLSLLLTITIPFLIVFIAGILSILFTYMDILFKKINIIKLMFFTLVALCVFALLIYLVNQLPLHLQIVDLWYDMVDKVTKFVNKTLDYTILSRSMTLFAMEGSMKGFAIVFGTLACVTLLNIFLCYRFFFSLVYKPLNDKPIVFAHKTKNKQAKSTFYIFFRKEFKTYLRSKDGFITSLIYILVLPVILYCVNRIFASFEISSKGANMIMAINIMVSIILISASNNSVANAISQEGSEFYLLKVTPINSKQIILAKMLINIVLTTIASLGVYFSLQLIVQITKIDIITQENLIVLLFVVLFVSLAHIFWSLELDITNSHVKQTIAGEKENSNVTKSVFIGIGLGIILGIAYYAFSILRVYGFNPKTQTSILIIAFLIFASRLYLLIKKSGAYFDEITM